MKHRGLTSFLRASSVALGLVTAFVGCGAAGTATGATPDEECSQPVDPDGGGAVPEAPDGAAACAPGACNYQSQEGCGAGQACVPQVDRAQGGVVPTCAPEGPGTLGAPCTQGEAGCAAGYFCFEGACRKLCCGGDWSACDPGESCLRPLFFRVDGQDLPAGVEVCAKVNDCDVLDPGACAAQDRVCRIVDPTGAVACAPRSDRDLGDPCDAEHQCGPVQHCVAGECRRLCSLDVCSDESCAPGETCVHFARDPEGVGECTADWVISD